ncbi:MAG: VOC family protein [Acidobacteriota bacterium]|nr:VOC family protein [Acidobacteriota bacterium]
MQCKSLSLAACTCRVEAGRITRRISRQSVWLALAISFAASLIAPSGVSYGQAAQPHIIGMAHMAYYVSDLKKAREYYEGFLGFQEAFALKNADGTDHAVYVKINDHQYIELYNEPAKDYGYIHDAGFETNDAKGMRDHLASIGVKVPEKVVKDEAGNLSFEITEPSGFTLQIVQYLPGSMTDKAKGKFMPAARIADHIDHIGLLIKDKDESWKFYSEAFGFIKEGDGTKMIVPGGKDRFELGWEKKQPPAEARFHVKDHICLSVPDAPKMTAMLKAKPQVAEFPDAIADIHQLGNGKNVVEIYDLDHNRVETMEPPKTGE